MKSYNSTHIFVHKKNLIIPHTEWRNRLTITPKGDDKAPFPIYVEDGDYFGFPRYMPGIDKIAGVIEDKSVLGRKISYGFKNEPRDYQKAIISEFKTAISRGSTGIILSAKTGSGKTYCGSQFINAIGRTTLITVPRVFIMHQWINALLEHTTLKRSDIGICQGDTCEFEGKKIVVGVINSVANRDYGDKFNKYFGTIIVDEVHTVATRSFSKVYSKFPAIYRIGLSADYYRKDGTTNVIVWSTGQIIIKSDAGIDNPPRVVVKRGHSGYTTPKFMDEWSAKQRRGRILKVISEIDSRNCYLASALKQLYESGRRCLLLSGFKNQLEHVKRELIKSNVSPDSIGIFTGATKQNERERIAEESDIILATYGVMSMAVDVPDLRGLVYGTPISDPTQPAGRILRRCDGAKNPVIIDLVDSDIEECVRYYDVRRAYYVRVGAEIFSLT